MDNVNFLRVQLFVFRLMGINLHNREKDFSAFTSFLIFAMVSFNAPMGNSVRQNLTNVSNVSDTMGSVLATSLTFTKYLTFFYYRRELVELVNRIRRILNAEMEAWPPAFEIVEAENRSDQRLSGLYIRCFIAAGVFASVKPLVTMGLAVMRTGSTMLELPYVAQYPWDNQVVYFYVPTYVWNMLVGYTAVVMALCMDTLLFALIYNVCAIFRVAQQRAIALGEVKGTAKEEFESLLQVLELHQTGLRIAEQLLSYFQPLVFMHFLVSAVMMCFVGFQAADWFPKPQFIYFMAFVSSLLIAVFIYSYCGEHLKHESAAFAEAICDSAWYKFSPASKKALLLAIMRSQRPCELRGYFFEANMATFSMIVRSTVSYIMMLRSFR
ncbi:odorant receptor 9a [Scaptodrosophila lebanonensis]|uniref:Odorant receptor n=1 Tax=Drosophila lebanonensis TaxID=7225 RepID=A0A6J2U0D5_DROLE|nr:odorant receptor 9a [Scaptodrosophila lebanonensis]